MFETVADLIKLTKEYGSIAEVMIQMEMHNYERKREDILAQMDHQLTVMENSVTKGVQGVSSVTGLTGGDAKRLDDYLQNGGGISGIPILKAVRNAIAVNEVNAQMGVICANPTAGSAGVAAGVVTALKETQHISRQDQLDFLFTAGAFGLVIANKASISGAEGGCQAEIGSSTAMASAGIVAVMGGTPEACGHAAAIAIKNTLGLICDPVAGLVEVPCVKRNALGASLAFIAADMALSGIKSVIPVDEVIDTMGRVGRQLPAMFKETADGGLAQTPTALAAARHIFGEKGV